MPSAIARLIGFEELTMRTRSAAPSPRTLPLQPGLIYGPVRSRRLGFSLGINLLPSRDTPCSFNCLYCRYGWTLGSRLAPTHQLKDVPRAAEVLAALDNALCELRQERPAIDAITICGNGEPTLHPELRQVVKEAKKLRDRYVPDVRLAIFSNSSTIASENVRQTLELFDVKIMKFDAGSEELMKRLNHPASPMYLGEIVAGLAKLTDVYLASLFVQGKVTNTDPDSIDLWIEKVGEIRPYRVHIYSLDQAAADPKIEKVNMVTLQWIADRLHWRTGLPVEFY